MPVFAQQQQAAQDTLAATQKLGDVVVTGQYGENSLSRSVYKMRVIDQKRIRALGANNLKDVLAVELNIRINNDPALGSTISIQGINGQNVKIMIDGVPVAGREGGGIDLTQINLNNIERIEVVEGPMSVSFGTDALGGVINLITKKPASRRLSVGANTYYESIGQYNAGVQTALSGKKWGMQVNAARNFFDGYSPGNSGRFKLWKPRTQYFGDLNFSRSINNGTLRLNNSFFDEKVTNRDSGTITPYYAYGQDQYYYTRRLTSALFFEKRFREKFLFNVVASYSYYRRINNTVHKDLVTLEEQPVPSADLHDTSFYHLAMSRGTLSYRKSRNSTAYQGGYEVNYERASGEKISGGGQYIADINAFGSAEVKIGERLWLRPGLRYVYNTKYNAPLIPSFNVKWDAASYVTVRASYGRGFRAPSLKELYLNFVDPSHNVHGNTSLKAETQDNVQLSATFESKKAGRVFRFEPSLFYNKIYNKIDLALLSAITLEARYVNINTFQSTGINFNSEYRSPYYYLSAGYSYTGINNSLAQSASTDKFFFTNEVRASAGYTFRRIDLTWSAFLKYNGRMQAYYYNITDNTVELGYINGYSQLDMSLGKALFKKSLNITAGVKNLLNNVNVAANISTGVHAAQGNAATVGMGRTVFVSLQYTFDREFKK